MNLTASLLEHTFVYRMWQAPFAEQKFAPVLAHNDLGAVRRVLDVACGPGTNTGHFANSDYLGIDLKRNAIFGTRMRVRNAISSSQTFALFEFVERISLILVISFLHHLANPEVAAILTHLRTLLTEDGHIHFLELVMPQQASIARWLARSDRGKYARPLEEWEHIFGGFFDPVVVEAYPLVGFGATLWNMIYFKGKSNTPSSSTVL